MIFHCQMKICPCSSTFFVELCFIIPRGPLSLFFWTLDRYYFLPVSYFIFTQKAWEMLTGMFLISLLVAVCLLLLVRFLIKHQQQKALTRNMTQIGPCHPIWGHLHLVSNDFRCYWTTWEILKWMTVHHVQIYSPCWYF